MTDQMDDPMPEVKGSARTLYTVGHGDARMTTTKLPEAIREAARRVLRRAKEPELYDLRIIQRRGRTGDLVVISERTDGSPSYLTGEIVSASLEALDHEGEQ